MPTIIDGSASATFATPLPLLQGGTGSVVGAISGPNGSAFALRNRIINGDMRIDQRNNGAAVTVTGFVFTVDRYGAGNNTGTGTISLQQATLGNAKSLKATATSAITTLTANNNIRVLQQVIESQNIFDLNNKAVTLSFLVETNWSGNLAVALTNGAGTRSYATDVAVVSGTNVVSVTLTLESNTVATNNNTSGFVLLIGSNNEGDRRAATAGVWGAGNLWVSPNSTQWAKTTGNFINVTNVQLEEGTVATPFERRPIGVELALCQRYLPAFNSLSTLHTLGAGQAISTASVLIPMNLPVTARVAPTGLILSALAHLTARTATGGSAPLFSSASISNSSTTCPELYLQGSSGLVTGDASIAFFNTNGAFLYFTGCEL